MDEGDPKLKTGRVLSEVLHAAEVGLPSVQDKDALHSVQAVTEYAKRAVAPPEGTPASGATAHRQIVTYGEAFAAYLEVIGQRAVDEAEAYNARCKQLAETIREDATAEANRAARYTTKINSMAMALDKVHTMHKEGIDGTEQD